MKTSLIIIVLLSFFGACSNDKGNEETSVEKVKNTTETYYTCSMHPHVKEDKPGKCPICHMNLSKVEVDHSEHEMTKDTGKAKELWQCENDPSLTSESPSECPTDGTPMVKVVSDRAGEVVAKVSLRKSQLTHFKADVFPVTTMKMTKNVRLLGTVLQSEEKESNIPARVNGRVEKVYVKSTGSFVQKGAPVVDLYSPKLITAGEEYLLARKSYESSKTKEFKEMFEQSAQRLIQWGVRSSQFKSWFKKNKVPKNITIYSNSSGVVKRRNALKGKYFKEGQNFFELTDLSDVWVEMDVYEHDSSLVKIGQVVILEFTSIPGEKIEGEIDFVAPVLDRKTRTLKLRATIKNKDGKLKPGMVADATLKLHFDGMPLAIPRTAIIDTGKRKVVWLKLSESKYQARVVLTGLESEGYVQVAKGLSEGDEVVIEGNFLLDSQAQLFGGYEAFKSSTGHQH